MSSGAFSIDQLMELAGLSVSQAGTFQNSPITPIHDFNDPKYSNCNLSTKARES